MKRYEFLVLTRPIAGTDEEFNHWYDREHLRDVLKVPGIIAARRFRVLALPSNPESPQWPYVAIYELECDDPGAVLAEITRRAGTELMPISVTLDRSATARFLLQEISPRQESTSRFGAP
jgi:hypothetical protein